MKQNEKNNKNIFNTKEINELRKSNFNTEEIDQIKDLKAKYKIPYIAKNLHEGNSLIRINNLTKIFNKNFVAIDNLNMDVKEGQNIAILGGNGAGKTTLVEIIAGLNKASKGYIEYNLGHKIHFQEKIGIQFQNSSYPSGIKVKRVIKFVLDIYNAKLNKNEISELINIFGLREFYNKNASSLSGGQQQRLNALLAILHRPKIIILDELSTGLDIIIRNEIKRFIKNYALKHKITILIISHDMDEVAFLADRIIILSKGSIIYDDSKEITLENFGSLEKCFEFFNKINI
ncbi:ABC transporter ATP-binding protein [[Mycoplasma] mobile]|uniref:Unspecified ABC transporter ATP-binding subunit n=1 Tax=Mycoplasma mobile (strain ATCC 43663 / 163K / NCTC 11711) TaxID=267748 RepID=Q6KI94_MYCM1|nr:ABC transporter ATP-binding protein [[Mycoplasma] mobile]AAT27682.1 unspecified ABC transporter ATP-binding subunit [Mycoplasma mobile 163K]